MHRATKDLAESGILTKALKVSDMISDFVLKNTGSQDVSLTELTGRGPVVLLVYRGHC